jgi:hypothetical protein
MALSNTMRKKMSLAIPVAVITLAVVYAATFFLLDFLHEGKGFGWDAISYCATIDAYWKGLDPYYVKNLEGTNLSYSYAPFTFWLMTPFCFDHFFDRSFRFFFPALVLMAALLLAITFVPRSNPRGRWLTALFVFFGFDGFQWVYRCANLSVIEGGLMAVALALLFHAAKNRRDPYAIGAAALLGFSSAIKILFCPLLLGLYLFPASRKTRILMLGVAGICFVAPVVAWLLIEPNLFWSWVDCQLGRIPGQHSFSKQLCTATLYCMAHTIGDHLSADKLIAEGIGTLLSGLFLAGVLLPLIGRIVQIMPKRDGKPLLSRLDRWLMEEPRLALHLMLLSMLGLALCSPHLKEYGYFEIVIYAAAMIGNLSIGETAYVFAIGVILPLIPCSFTHVKFYSHLLGGYGQLVSALMVYGFLIYKLPAVARRRRAF